ncbi:uncharacterized protein LOC127853091 isoform X1 [Dreissena polymorpha]|uniref:Protein kinase domain-containing protein n=1 Tax=Dreissena polymorpha TaxID=45954 RepID=A0A9D4CQ88_DREPO|nr:uncharacterized protein LOC127853091 isoform X1 [Dreissena polymorpha]XP_052243248.1 uncharacterized protein LOC127853091 isoform X1 [Dreissena polymorpha]KAH3729615.1 hypothetical protein DPMN_055590 [Dreissena polymorpha]
MMVIDTENRSHNCEHTYTSGLETAGSRVNDVILHENMRDHTTGSFHMTERDTHMETKRTNEENDLHINSSKAFESYNVSEKNHEHELQSVSEIEFEVVFYSIENASEPCLALVTSLQEFLKTADKTMKILATSGHYLPVHVNDCHGTDAIMPFQNDAEVGAGSKGHVSDSAFIKMPEPIAPLRRVQFRSPRAYVPREHKMVPEKGRCKQSQSSESIVRRSGPAGSPSNTLSKGKRNDDKYHSSNYTEHSRGYSRQTATTERRSSIDTNKHTKHDSSNTANTPRQYSYWKSENTDRYPSWKQSRSPQKRFISYHSMPEVKQITILKKVHEDTNILHEPQKSSPETNTETVEEAVSEPIFYPELTNLREVGSSVYISKSQSTVRDGPADDTRRSRSSVTSTDDVREEQSKHKQKQARKRRRSLKDKKPAKSQMVILQKTISSGQLRSKVSRYKTEGLVNIKLIEKIHEGVFTERFRATYQNKQVVLTMIAKKDACLIDDMEMARLGNCYFIVGIMDVMSAPIGSVWFMSRYHSLTTLEKLLALDPDRHVLGEAHAQFIIAGVFIGVDFLHTRDIVHGNIRPSKVLFNDLGYPVLGGYIKRIEGPDVDPLDVHTQTYSAPERFRGRRGPYVDVFSIGCLAYEIITGRYAFTDWTNNRFKIEPVYSPELFSFAGEAFIRSCLRLNSEDRFEIGVDRQNLYLEEWFSTLDWKEYRKQTLKSPIPEVLQLLANKATLTWWEKTITYPWGRVMDVVCPWAASLDLADDASHLAAMDACIVECAR